jgi:hypothetical protein
LRLKYDEVLSNFAFNFNFRRYTVGGQLPQAAAGDGPAGQRAVGRGVTTLHFSPPPEPNLLLKPHGNAQRIPRKVLRVSWKVDEWKPLAVGHRRGLRGHHLGRAVLADSIKPCVESVHGLRA